MPELAIEAMKEAMQVTTNDKVAEFETRLKAKGLLLEDALFVEPEPTTPQPPNSVNATDIQKKTAEAKKIEKEIKALESERASRKKSGLRLDDDLTELLSKNRLDGVADLLRKSRVSSVAMLKEHSLAELEEALRRSGGELELAASSSPNVNPGARQTGSQPAPRRLRLQLWGRMRAL